MFIPSYQPSRIIGRSIIYNNDLVINICLIKSITNQTNSQTFSERVMSEKKIQTMIPLNKLQDIFSYKEPIDASIAEALRISEGLIKP